MLPGGFQQTLFTKFLALTVQSFRNTIGVKQDGVARSQFAFFHRAIPFLEQAHHSAGCPQPFQTVDRKSTRLNSSHGYISYAVFCLKKKATAPRRRSCQSLFSMSGSNSTGNRLLCRLDLSAVRLNALRIARESYVENLKPLSTLTLY